MEIWKDIEGYDGYYQVSNEGRVRSLDRTIIDNIGRLRRYKGRIKELEELNHGHLSVNLSKDGVIEKHKTVHRLVAEAFIPNPHGYTVVHHKNHNPKDNRVENLEWISDEEHRGIHIKERRSKTVYQYTLNGELVAVWTNAYEAARELDLGQCYICLACNNKYRREGNNIYKNFIWSYGRLCG